MAPTDLEARARRVYEVGRARWASGFALLALPLLAVAWLIGRPPVLVASVGAALVAVSAGLAFARTKHEPAILVGLLAGVPPLLLPFIVKSCGHFCAGGSCMAYCLPACFIGGALAGMLVGMRAAEAGSRWTFGGIAMLVAGLAGVLGCTLAGGAGVLGMIAGLVLGTTPLLLRAEVRRA
jgi:hypothetical protein